MSQEEKILNYIKAGFRINTWTAYDKFKITTLAQRVKKLKDRSIIRPIIHNGVECEIRDETVRRDGKTFSEYYLVPKKNQMELELK